VDSFSSIAVVGLGYIGLPTAAVFAANGVEVVASTTNPRVVETINQGNRTSASRTWTPLVRRVVEGGKLRASLAMAPADAFNHPADPLGAHWSGHDGQPDLRYVSRPAARAVAAGAAAAIWLFWSPPHRSAPPSGWRDSGRIEAGSFFPEQKASWRRCRWRIVRSACCRGAFSMRSSTTHASSGA